MYGPWSKTTIMDQIMASFTICCFYRHNHSIKIGLKNSGPQQVFTSLIRISKVPEVPEEHTETTPKIEM